MYGRGHKESCEHLLEPALEVGDLREDFDPDIPPLTGQEYIQRVVLEARRCDDVVVAEIDRSRLKDQTVRVEMIADYPSTPSRLMPSLAWQQYQVAEFSAVRQALARHKAERPPPHDARLPNKEDERGWRVLCLGSDGGRVDLEGHTQEAVAPLLSVMLAMNQPVIEQVLEYHVEWLEARHELSAQQGRWLYSLLACLELPLVPETCSLLRTLARECGRIRAAAAETATDVSVAPLNLLICLVARYFHQMDLADT